VVVRNVKIALPNHSRGTIFRASLLVMTLSLRPSSLKRYRDLIALFYKYGHGDLVKKAPIVDDPLPHAAPPPVPLEAAEFAKDLEKLGPTYIKLGQLLSTRSDFVPAAYMEALARLQDNADPFPIDNVQSIVAVEIGVRLNKAFLEFEPVPFATASLGQVHHAVLRSGQRVVVKVQRPGARELVADDLEAMTELAEFLDLHTDLGRRHHFSSIVSELRKTLLQELDYRLELVNLRNMRAALAEFETIMVPQPIEDYSSGRVLTMEYVSGVKITKLSRLARLDMEGDQLAEDLFRAYLHQILVVGMFHADPHPGNVFLTQDHRIALLDLGMVGRLEGTVQQHLLKLLLAISEGNGERAADTAVKMGTPNEDFDELQFRRRISELVMLQKEKPLENLQVGKVVMEVQRISADCGLTVIPQLTMLGKTLLNLDLVGRTLSPQFNPNDSIRRNAAKILQERTKQSLAPANLLSVLLDAKDLVEQLPNRINQLLELVATNKVRVKVDSINENLLITSFQKIANRITLGLILAAMIVAASLMMRVDTEFRVFGYPGIGMILFIFAMIGGGGLALQIVRSDTSQK
jgi:ubiquinone biosynthesis protein